MSFVLVSRNKKKDMDAQPASGGTNDAREQDIQRRVQDELERLRHTAMEEAKSTAEAMARASIQPLETQLQQAMSALREANAQLATPLARKEQDLAELVLDMAFQLARHIIGVQVTQDREPLLDLVTKLLLEAGSERGAQQNLVVRLHPSDLSFIKDRLPEADASLTPDTTLAPGDALVELVSQNADLFDKTEWDARLESRLEAVGQALLASDKDME